MIELVGYMAASMTSLGSLPQLWKMFNTGQSRDVSIATYIVLLVGSILWCYYGFKIDSLPIIIADIISIVIFSTIISIALIHKLK